MSPPSVVPFERDQRPGVQRDAGHRLVRFRVALGAMPSARSAARRSAAVSGPPVSASIWSSIARRSSSFACCWRARLRYALTLAASPRRTALRARAASFLGGLTAIFSVVVIPAVLLPCPVRSSPLLLCVPARASDAPFFATAAGWKTPKMEPAEPLTAGVALGSARPWSCPLNTASIASKRRSPCSGARRRVCAVRWRDEQPARASKASQLSSFASRAPRHRVCRCGRHVERLLRSGNCRDRSRGRFRWRRRTEHGSDPRSIGSRWRERSRRRSITAGAW